MKKAIIIAILIIVFAALAVGVLFFLKNNQIPQTVPPQNTTGTLPVSTSTGGNPIGQESSTPTGPEPVPAGATISLGDTSVSSTDITSGEPADAPQGATLQFQTASGTVALNNFYASAQGYWAALNTVLIAYNPGYAIWYYRDTSQFAIDVPLGGTQADEDSAAGVLAQDLGVSQQALCGLPVTVIFDADRGISNFEYPLDFCTTPGVINSD